MNQRHYQQYVSSVKTPKITKVLSLTQREGVIRARDLKPHNIPLTYLARLCDAGAVADAPRYTIVHKMPVSFVSP